MTSKSLALLEAEPDRESQEAAVGLLDKDDQCVLKAGYFHASY
jgi:hypothetical protein